MKALAAAVLAALTPILAFAQSIDRDDWTNATRPATAVSVSPTDKPGVYVVSAKVTDLATDKVLAAPSLQTVAGIPATFELGVEPTVTIKFVVSVQADGRSAHYTSEVRRNGKVESAHSATLALERQG